VEGGGFRTWNATTTNKREEGKGVGGKSPWKVFTPFEKTQVGRKRGRTHQTRMGNQTPAKAANGVGCAGQGPRVEKGKKKRKTTDEGRKSGNCFTLGVPKKRKGILESVSTWETEVRGGGGGKKKGKKLEYTQLGTWGKFGERAFGGISKKKKKRNPSSGANTAVVGGEGKTIQH